MARDPIPAAELGGRALTAEELAAIPDFSGIRKEIWDKFPGAVARKEYRPGEILMREGENGTTAFYILSGSVEVSIRSPVARLESHKEPSRGLFGTARKRTRLAPAGPRPDDAQARTPTHIPIDAGIDLPMEKPLAALGEGDLIGELAALAALKQERLKRPKFYPRSATVRALTDVVALELLPNILNNVLYNAPAFKERLNRNYRSRALANHLRSVPALAGLSDRFLESLRERVELVDVQPGQVICRQDEAADAFYLIRLGFVKVSQSFPGGDLVLTYLSRGAYFGEIGLLGAALDEDPARAGRRVATCTAVDYVQLVRISAADFANMVEEFPEVRAGLVATARERLAMDSQMMSRVQTLSLDQFLGQELMQAQNLLLIDLDKCTRCDECVKACAATHEDGVTRLIRDGLRFDKYLVPTSCRACLDPLCMTRCPVGSIRRKSTLDIVIEDWCIGCGNCAADCPYGNINVVLIAGLGGDRRQKAEPRPKAVVCDLCREYDEPNCVRACPHEAAIRVEPHTFFGTELAAGFPPAPTGRVS